MSHYNDERKVAFAILTDMPIGHKWNAKTDTMFSVWLKAKWREFQSGPNQTRFTSAGQKAFNRWLGQLVAKKEKQNAANS